MNPMPHAAPADSARLVPAETSPAAMPRAAWRLGLPTLKGASVELRELRPSDAPMLLGAMASDAVSRFISPPPSTLEGFEKFITWAQRERATGPYLCFAIVPRGTDTAVGLLQLRSLEREFATAEWGFALAAEYWGAGLFTEAATLFIEFALTVVGTHRLEARAAVKNGRGNAALQKVGAVQEGVLRRSFFRHGEYLDQALWTIISEEWLQAKAVWGARIVH